MALIFSLIVIYFIFQWSPILGGIVLLCTISHFIEMSGRKARIAERRRYEAVINHKLNNP